MLEPKYHLPPPDLKAAVENNELVFFVLGYVDASPFTLVEWASGIDEHSPIVGESLFRDGELLISQPGNELRQSLSAVASKRNYKSDPNLPVSIDDLLTSPALSYGLSGLELSRLNDPSNYIALKLL